MQWAKRIMTAREYHPVGKGMEQGVEGLCSMGVMPLSQGVAALTRGNAESRK